MIVLDTSFIITALKLKIDFVSELKKMGYLSAVIPSPILSELKALASKKTKESIYAKLFFKIKEAHPYFFITTKTKNKGDLSTIELKLPIATVDKKLIKLAKKKKIPTITIKNTKIEET